jgi:tRNA nucleotidyltransferase (CCA-adding enzyme)
MAYNYKDSLIDYYEGYEDLKQNNIKCVGNPISRFSEDSLRLMRCIRFACQLGFTIEEDTFLSIKECASLIVNISQERIRDELCKILLSDRPIEGIQLLEKSGLLKHILPELQECVGFDQYNYHHRKNVFDHILKVLDVTPCSLNIRLAALLHDIAKPDTFSIGEDGVGHFYGHHIVGADMTVEILKRFKFDNETINNVSILVKEHMARYPKLRKSSTKKLINRLGKHNIDDFINLQIADIIGSKPPYDFESVINLKKEIQRVLEAKEPLSVKDLAVNGHDLMSVGIQPGKRIGEILNNLLEIVLNDPEMNNKEKLLECVFK